MSALEAAEAKRSHEAVEAPTARTAGVGAETADIANQSLWRHLGGDAAYGTPSGLAGQAQQSRRFGAPALAANKPGGASNQRLLALQRAGRLRAKLEIGAVNDPAEAEADRMADAALAGRAPCSCGGVCSACVGGGALRRKTDGGAGRTPAVSRSEAFADAGRPLEPGPRGFFEQRFGADFSAVRVHDGDPDAAAARRLGARAFAVDGHIGFGAGEYAPDTQRGRLLLAHELAHVLQPRSGVIARYALDPANPDAWGGWYDKKEHRDESFVETVDQASKAASAMGKDLSTAAAPTTDEERDAMDAKIRTLIRLQAVAMVGAHRNEILNRKAQFGAMLAAPPAAEGQAGPTVGESERRADTARAIKSAAQSVVTLKAWKARLESSRDTLDSAVRMNALEDIPDEFNTLQQNAYPEPPKDLAQHLSATKAEMVGVSVGTKKVRLFDLRNYLVGVRARQIGGVDRSMAEYYDKFPFLADLSAETITTGHDLSKSTRTAIAAGLAGLLLPILGPFAGALAGQDREMDDAALLTEVQASFDRLLEKTDEAIVEVGSGGIDPLDLPGAVGAAKAALPAPLQTELARLQSDHEAFKFAVDMVLALGIAVLAGVTGGLGAIGAAGWAATTGAAAAGLGAVQVAAQAKDMLDRQTLADAATNPQGELLGVSAPSTFEKIGLAVGILLTAVDLVGVAAEFRSAKPHFAEEPHGPAGREELPPDSATKDGKPGSPDAALPAALPGPTYDAAEIQRNLAHAEPGPTPGSIKVPIAEDEGHFWLRENNKWCRYSGTPTNCFGGGTFEGEALEEQLQTFSRKDAELARDREILNDNLGPGEGQAHHIIPLEFKDDEVVRYMIDHYGFDINGSNNGMRLPSEPTQAAAGKLPVHDTAHPAYSNSIGARLENMKGEWRAGRISDDQLHQKFLGLIDEYRGRLGKDFPAGQRIP